MKKIFAILVILVSTSAIAHADNLEVLQMAAMKLSVAGNQHGTTPAFSNEEIQQLEAIQDTATEAEAGKVGYLLQRIAELRAGQQ